jgi:aminopeptidase N
MRLRITSSSVWIERLGADELAAYAEESDWMGYFTGALYDNPEPFGSTVYQKGGLVLHMLRHVVGDDAFFAGLASYRTAFGGDTATSEGLREQMEAASGTDLTWFFDEWVYGEGRPRYQYSWSEVPGPAVRLTVKQIQTNSPLYRMSMDVRVTTTAGTEETVVWLGRWPSRASTFRSPPPPPPSS